MRIFVTVIALILTAEFTYSQSPQRIEAMRMVQEGDNNIQLGRHEDAIFKYTNAITTDPSYAEALIKRASVYHRVGRYTEAERDLTMAQRIKRRFDSLGRSRLCHTNKSARNCTGSHILSVL